MLTKIKKLIAERPIAFMALIGVVIWMIKPDSISIDCLGCVTVPPLQQGTITTTTTNEDGKESTTVTSSSSHPPPSLSIDKTCVGELIIPRGVAKLSPIPDAIKNDSKKYIVALEQRITVLEDMTEDYQSRVESNIRRYNLTCK